MMVPFMLGFLISSGIAVLAYFKEALNTSGASAAVFIGMLVYGFGGMSAYLLLISFFILSSLISHFNPDRENPDRNAIQVFANGGLATVFIVLYGAFGTEIYLALFIGSIAVAAADTWSSEIGRLSNRIPVSILTFKPMQKNLSGAVTFLGLLAAFVAALFYAFWGFFFLVSSYHVLIILIVGFSGSIIDSLLGLMQAKYKDEDGKLYDDKGDGLTHVSGIAWINNNVVNVFSNLISVGIMCLLMLYF